MILKNLSSGAVLACLAGAAVLSGCTPADSSSSATATPEPTTIATVAAEAPADTIDPCDLISAERLSELTGIDMAEGVYNGGLSDSGRNVCDWRPADEERSEPRLTVTVNWGFPDAAAHRALGEEVLGEGKDATIEGATDAYRLPGRTTWGMTIDDVFLKVSYIEDSSDAGDTAKSIAHSTAKSLVELTS